MAAVTLTLTGDKELSSMFHQLPDKVQRSLVRTELRGALKPVLSQAKVIARKKSGAMARTLTIRAMKRKKGRIGYYIRTGTRAELQKALSKRGGTLAGKVLGGGRYGAKARRQLQGIGRTMRRLSSGQQAYYPSIIELGTMKRPAYSYLRASFDTQKERMVSTMVQGLNDALDEATRT